MNTVSVHSSQVKQHQQFKQKLDDTIPRPSIYVDVYICYSDSLKYMNM